MLKNSWLLLKAYVAKWRLQLKKGYEALLLYILAVVAVLLIGLLINVQAGPSWNLITFFVVGSAIFIVGLSPAAFSAGAFLGLAFAFLRDEDLTQGVAKGLLIPVKITILVTFWYLIMILVLASLPFEKSPLAFFQLAAGGIVLALIAAHYGMKSGWVVKWSAILYTLAFMGVALHSTIDFEDKKDKVKQEVATTIIGGCTGYDSVRIVDFHLQPGEEKEVDIQDCFGFPKSNVLGWTVAFAPKQKKGVCFGAKLENQDKAISICKGSGKSVTFPADVASAYVSFMALDKPVTVRLTLTPGVKI